MPRFEVEAGGRRFEVEAPTMDAAMGALRGLSGGTPAAAPATDAAAGAESPELSWGQWIGDLFTGSLRTEFPDAPEFGRALTDAANEAGRGTPAPLQVLGTLVTPDPKAQVDILRRGIPDLEDRTDRFGNVMLRAPSAGVTDWSYLNAPGLSARDVGETLAQTAAFVPAFRFAGGAATALGAFGRGALASAGTSVAEDVAATGLGSEQGVDPLRAAVTGATGGMLAPSVPSAIARGVASVPGRVATAVRESPLGGMTRTARAGMAGEQGVEAEALRRVREARTRDAALTPQLTPDQATQAGTARQPLMAIDAGETTRALARSAANTSPEGRDVITRAVQGRFEAQADRASEFLRTLVGSRATAHTLRQGLEQQRFVTGGPLYRRAYADGANGRWSPALSRLWTDDAMQPFLDKARQLMNLKQAARTMQTASFAPNGRPTLEFWDQVSRAIGDEIGRREQQGARELVMHLTSLQHELIGHLDDLFPGYGHARGAVAGFFRASDALDAGEQFAMRNYGLDDAARVLDDASENERALFREGFASRLLERMNSVADRRSIINQVAGTPTARRKLDIALGPFRARRMEAFMRVEDVMDRARMALGNSTTTRQLVEMGLAGGTGFVFGGPPGAMFAAGLVWGARRALGGVDERVAQRVAQLLVSNDPRIQQQGVDQIARSEPLRAALRELYEMMGRITPEGTGTVARAAALQETQD